MFFSKMAPKWLQFLITFLIHINNLMMCRNFEPTQTLLYTCTCYYCLYSVGGPRVASIGITNCITGRSYTSDYVEVAVGFLKECGQKLTQLSPRGVTGVFESLKAILHDASVGIRVQYMIEVMFAIRKDRFADYPSIIEGLNLINEDNQITHLISLDDELDAEDDINVFKVDSEYQENEDRYKAIKEEILGEGSSDDEEGESEDEEESEEEEEEGERNISKTIKL
uniref:MIF4G domain-containing protein n=1 Tax=Amphimedon queenslandica TaxID=400682 RepID=A0A1X7TKF2_AMPQE